jgi:site-specific recombinase XerD
VEHCRHWQENEHDPAKRAFTHEELQAFFDHADAEVDRVRKLGRKGWLPAFRDATLFKTAYAFGLRRNEVRHLRTFDFERNPHAREFGRYGALEVRYGKAHKGSAPKRRTVLTVFDWSAEVLAHWVEQGLPRCAGEGLGLFPNERGGLVSEGALGGRFRRYRQQLGLDAALDMHSFRRSYATHLIEAGFDSLLVQKRLGHEHASTTAIYEFVSDDYRRTMLRNALDTTIRDATASEPRYPEATVDGSTIGMFVSYGDCGDAWVKAPDGGIATLIWETGEPAYFRESIPPDPAGRWGTYAVQVDLPMTTDDEAAGYLRALLPE